MMEDILKFPTLKNEEVAILRANAMTGHILDEKYTLYMKNNNQTVFSIFSNRKEAIDFIINNRQPNIEFVVFDRNKHIVYPSEYIEK